MRRHPILLAAVLTGGVLTTITLAQTNGPANPVPPVISTGSNPILTADSERGLASRSWNLRQTPIVDAVRRVRDCVVNIHSERTVLGPASDELFANTPSQNRINGMGTGIVIDPRGYIVTNQHVVEDVNVIRVRTADGAVSSARVLARDNESDLALLKIDVNRPLPVMPLGTATDLMIGETCIAIGNAYGYEHTVSVGVVSAVGRDVTLNKEVSYKSLIQTDAAINPGNSGGPLINIYGDLIGVNVAIRAGAQGIGFAIPVETMIRTAGNMLRGRSRSGGLASMGLSVRDTLRKPGDEAGPLRSVVVERVDPQSPAGKAGLQNGDLLVKLGETTLASSLDGERALLDAQTGETVGLLVRRQGLDRRLDLTVETVHNAPAQGTDVVWRKLGLRLHPIPAEDVARNHPQLHGGLLIGEVRSESAAAKAGLQRGDILVGLHLWEMLNLENCLFVLNHPEAATFSPLRFYILRGNQVHRGWLQNLD